MSGKNPVRWLFKNLHIHGTKKKSSPTKGPEQATGAAVVAEPAAIETIDEASPTIYPTKVETRDEPTVGSRPETLGLNILYEPPEGRHPAVDIIFIHGLTGSSHDTWSYGRGGNGTHWPKEILKIDIPDARILSFGYDADVVGWWSPVSNNRVANHAENLLGRVMRLKEKTSSEDRSVIFVMHSLGGLVVQNALDLSRSSPDAHLNKLEEATIGLLFMGTPHFGSDKAKWGGFSAAMMNVVRRTNKAIVQVLDPDSEMLAAIQKRFHQILRLRLANGSPISITCFYEELALPVLGTVSNCLRSRGAAGFTRD